LLLEKFEILLTCRWKKGRRSTKI